MPSQSRPNKDPSRTKSSADKMKNYENQGKLECFVSPPKKNISPQKHTVPVNQLKENNFAKKMESPDLPGVEANGNRNNGDPEMFFSHWDKTYPLSMKYYRQG